MSTVLVKKRLTTSGVRKRSSIFTKLRSMLRMKLGKMRARGRVRLAMMRRSASIVILLAVSAMIAVPGKSRLAVGHTHAAQDPAQPASPSYVSLTPENLDFGNQVVRRISAAKRITLKNPGGGLLYIDSVELGGDNPTAFAILNDTCTGAKVEPDRACIIDVTFTPLRTGGRNARLKINDNALDSPQRLKLKGNGINSNDVAPF
jgi:hypothetical protein